MSAASSIYLDNNATTRPDPRVLQAMDACHREAWANPSSRHRAGDAAARLLHQARVETASLLGVAPREVIFTGGGTEADNLALRGVLGATPGHLVVTAVEHPAVLETARDLAALGHCELTVLDVDGQGRLDLDALEAALRPGRTRLVSVMAANNETGIRFDLAAVAERVHRKGALLHTDAVNAVGKIPLDPGALGVDLLSLSAHKFHGPRGVGVLVARRGVALRCQLTGGGQERGRRSSTENVAGCVGLARALRLAVEALPTAGPAMRALRDRLEAGLTGALEGIRVTGAAADRLPNTLHCVVEGVEAEALLTLLDQEGVACSSGSACSTGALAPSHVLEAMGLAADDLHCALRLSLSRETTAAEIERVVEVLPALVGRLRALTAGEGRG